MSFNVSSSFIVYVGFVGTGTKLMGPKLYKISVI